MVWVSVVLLCFVGCFHSSSSGLGGLLYSCVSWGCFHSSSSGLGGLLYSCVSWGVFTAVVVVWVSVVLLCFVGCFHSSSSGLGVCCTLVFRGVFSQQ